MKDEKTLIKTTYPSSKNVYEIRQDETMKLHFWLYKNNKMVDVFSLQDIEEMLLKRKGVTK